MEDCKLTFTPSPDSQIAILRRKLKGFPVRKPFVFVVDQEQKKDRFRPGTRIGAVGAEIAPVKPRKAKGTTINSLIGNNRMRSRPSLEPQHSFKCEYCGRKSKAKSRKRKFCDNNGICESRARRERKSLDKSRRQSA